MADRQKFNPATKVYQKLFGEGDDNPYASSIGKQRLFADDQSPTGGVDDIDQARDLENQGSDFGYKTEPDSSSTLQGGSGVLLRLGRLLKKGGPASFIAGSLMAGGVFLNMFMGPAGMVSQMAEQLTEKFNYQDISANVRTKKILNMKKKGPDNLYGLITKQDKKLGFVGPKGRATRFGTVSDKMIARLEANGIEVKTEQAFFGKKRVTEITLKDSSLPGGQKVFTDASDFVEYANKNPIFLDKITASGRGKFGLWFDDVAGRVKGKLGIDFQRLKPKVSGDADVDDIKKKTSSQDLDEALEENVKKGAPDEGKLRGAAEIEGVDPEAAENVNKSIDESELTKKTGHQSLEGVSKLLGAIDKVADVCSVYNIINKVNYLVKVAKGMQLARYASKFLATASALKAGDATEEELTYFANKLTATQPIFKNNSGRQELVGYEPTAMDSQGMYYVMTGIMGVPNESTKRYQLGINDSNLLNSFTAAKVAIDNFIKQKDWNFNLTQFCHVMASPLVAGVGAVVGVAVCLFTAGTGCVGIAALKGVWFAGVQSAGFEIGKFWLSEQIQKTFGGSFVTKKTRGEDMGNALVSGSGYLMGKNASAGGNMPLTKTQALAYMEARDQYIAQKGAEIRATHSPFDITTRHTMMGSIVNKALPQMAKMYSFTGRMASVMSMGLGSVGVLLPGASAISEAEKNQLRSKAFEICQDAEFRSFADLDNDGKPDVALDPNCNWVVGIPVRELNSPNYAPPDVINYLAPGTFVVNKGVTTSIPVDYSMEARFDEKGKITNLSQLKSKGAAFSRYVTGVLRKGYFKPVDKEGRDCYFEPIFYDEPSEKGESKPHIISRGATGGEIMYTPDQIQNSCLDETGYGYEFEWRISDRNSESYFNSVIVTLTDEKGKVTGYTEKKFEYKPDPKPKFKNPKLALLNYKNRIGMNKTFLDCGVSSEDYFIQDDKFNPLLRFKHNCLSRGELPFGMNELQDSGDENEYIQKSWGRRATDWLLGGPMAKIVDRGQECVLSGENEKLTGRRDSGEVGGLADDRTISKLIQGVDLNNFCKKADIPRDKNAPGRAAGPNKFGNVSAKDRIMFALYYMDERIQCSLDEGSDCDQEALMTKFGQPNELPDATPYGEDSD